MSGPRRLDVYLHGRHAAVITKARNGLVLDYEREYVDTFGDYPLSYSLPMTTRQHKDALVANYLDNLMPDNGEVKREWARKHGAESDEPFDLLWYVGADCAGAASFFPHGTDPSKAGALEPADEAEIATRLREMRARSSSWVSSDSPGRFSLGGAQSKFALARHGDGWADPTGVYPSTHIFKTGVDGLESSDVIEYLTMRVANEVLGTVAPVSIERFEDQHALVVERFDRAADGELIARVHAEDMCQVLGLSSLRKYEHQGGPGITGIVKALDLLPAAGRAAAQEGFAVALAFNWVVGGTDAHAKNYSVYVGPHGTLTPLYDLSSFAPYTAPFFDKARETMSMMKMPMRISGNERFGDVDRMHWDSIARDARLEPRLLIDLIASMASYVPIAWAGEMVQLLQIDEALLTPVVLTSADALAAWCDQVLKMLGV